MKSEKSNSKKPPPPNPVGAKPAKQSTAKPTEQPKAAAKLPTESSVQKTVISANAAQ